MKLDLFCEILLVNYLYRSAMWFHYCNAKCVCICMRASSSKEPGQFSEYSHQTGARGSVVG
jgi:hypothetical protein